jgi:hypothetical protein
MSAALQRLKTPFEDHDSMLFASALDEKTNYPEFSAFPSIMPTLAEPLDPSDVDVESAAVPTTTDATQSRSMSLIAPSELLQNCFTALERTRKLRLNIRLDAGHTLLPEESSSHSNSLSSVLSSVPAVNSLDALPSSVVALRGVASVVMLISGADSCRSSVLDILAHQARLFIGRMVRRVKTFVDSGAKPANESQLLAMMMHSTNNTAVDLLTYYRRDVKGLYSRILHAETRLMSKYRKVVYSGAAPPNAATVLGQMQSSVVFFTSRYADKELPPEQDVDFLFGVAEPKREKEQQGSEKKTERPETATSIRIPASKYVVCLYSAVLVLL